MANLKIRNFVNSELEKLRNECNFTNEELLVFECKAKDMSNVQISITLSMSERKVSTLCSRISNKIMRVL